MRTASNTPNVSASIIEIALQSKFNIDKDAISALLDVIQATPNPVVATEVLLGVYEQPHIEDAELFSTDDMELISFVEYNKYTDEVSFNYFRVSTSQAWFRKDTEGNDVSQIVSKKYYADDASRELKMDEDAFTQTHERRVYDRKIDEYTSMNTKSRVEWNNFVNKHT